LYPTFDFPDTVDIEENSALVINLFNISYTPNAGIAGAFAYADTQLAAATVRLLGLLLFQVSIP